MKFQTFQPDDGFQQQPPQIIVNAPEEEDTDQINRSSFKSNTAVKPPRDPNNEGRPSIKRMQTCNLSDNEPAKIQNKLIAPQNNKKNF